MKLTYKKTPTTQAAKVLAKLPTTILGAEDKSLVEKLRAMVPVAPVEQTSPEEQAAKILAKLPGPKPKVEVKAAPTGSQKPQPVSGKKRADDPDKLDLLAQKLTMQRVKPQTVTGVRRL